jgi:hypothetical protein
MKKMIMASIVVMSIVSCGNNKGGNNDNPTTDSYKSTEGVQNVNGNIPDTGNLGATPHTEIPHRDSLIPDSGAAKPH